MSYEGGGGTQGPAGPTGPTGADGATGATGGISFSGPNGAVLWYDGTAVTGTTGLTWTETGSYTMVGGPSGNNFTFDDGNGNMQISFGQTDYGKQIKLFAGNTNIVLTDAITGDEAIAGNLSVIINGSAGASGDVLTSDGSITIWQAPVTTLQQGKQNLNSLTWTDDEAGHYYADFPLSQPLYNNSNVIVTMIDSSNITVAANCWIVNVSPNANGSGDLRIWLAGDPNADIYASWLITNAGSPD
jgi:hypothetical protein